MKYEQSTISDRLRAAIKQRVAEGTTLLELSKETNTQVASLSRFVNGKAGLTTDTLDRLARVVRMRVET